MELKKYKSPRNAVAALFILNGALFGAWASRIPSIQAEFGLSPKELGLYLLMLAGGAIVAFPVSGLLSDKYGAACIAKNSAPLYCLTLALIGFSSSLWALAVAILLFGACHGGMDVAMNTWGTEVEKSLDKPIMSFLHAMFSVGAGVGAAFGALTAWQQLTYTEHFVVFTLLMIPVIWFAHTPWVHQAKENNQVSNHQTLFIPRGAMLVVAFIAFCAALGEGAMADWSAVFLTDAIGSSISEAAVGYTVFSIAMVIMRLAGDRITMRLGAAKTIRLCGSFALLGSLTLISASTVIMTYLGLALLGMGFSIVMPLVFTRAASAGGNNAGATIASIASFGYGGMLLGPPVIGFIAEYLSLRSAFYLFAFVALIILIGATAFREKKEPKICSI